MEKGGADAVLSVKDAYTLDFLDLDAKDATQILRHEAGLNSIFDIM